MKEYLNANYELITVSNEHPVCVDWIEVPAGAECLRMWGLDFNFYKDSDELFWHKINKEWCVSFNKARLRGRKPVWKRDKPSLNDQYAEIEQVRQELKGIEATLAERRATYGCFEDVARTTEQIMKALADPRVNGLNELPYPHRMALYMIASKMSRIVNGDFNHKDSWHDIGGYAKLVEDLL